TQEDPWSGVLGATGSTTPAAPPAAAPSTPAPATPAPAPVEEPPPDPAKTAQRVALEALWGTPDSSAPADFNAPPPPGSPGSALVGVGDSGGGWMDNMGGAGNAPLAMTSPALAGLPPSGG